MPIRRRATAALTALPLALVGLTVAAPGARAASPNVVIGEVYGGGGNSGAVWRSDYVELANRSGEAIDLTGWSVRYWSASGTSAQTTPLSGSIAAGGRYLLQQADGANAAAAALPTPDATGTVAMSSSGGRVAVISPDGQSIDLLGWGAATESEGAPAGATSNTTSVARADACADTDLNAADFVVGAPTPQNATTPAVACGDPGEPQPQDPSSIAEIQGRAHLSPRAGSRVYGVEGIVVATSRSGLWIQSTQPDDDPATSEGLFVYTRSAPTATVGQTVSVDGAVSEFRPGGASGQANLTTTQIIAPQVVVTGAADVPDPVVLGVDAVAPQQTIEAGDPGSVEEEAATFNPQRDAIDFYESLEGMHVGVQDATAVGPTASFGEIPVVPGAQVDAVRSSAGGVVYGGYDQPNAMRVQVDDLLLPRDAMPSVDVGDTLTGLVSGPLDYSFANYKLLATQTPTARDGGLTREVTGRQRALQLSVASFNVENLAPSNPQEKFDRLAGQITHNLRSPDVLAVEEIQDNSGATNDGTVDSSETTDRLIAAVSAAGGPRYEAHWVDPVDGQDGGQPGGNIRNVFLVRTDRGITFVERTTGASDRASQVQTDLRRRPHLTESPGRINPSSAAWERSRKPLVGELRYLGQTVFVAAVHFSSKGGDQPLFGRWQQPTRSSEEQRHEQAREVKAWTDALLSADPRAKVVVAGDVNDFEFSETADILAAPVAGSSRAGMTDLPSTLPTPERWTYIYEGNSQVLDHLLVSPSLTPRRPHPFVESLQRLFGHTPTPAYDIVHTNSPFADQDSDHDPQVVRLDVLF